MIAWLGVLAIFLIFLIIFYISKSSESLSVIKGEDPGASDDSNRINGFLLLIFGVIFLVATVWSSFALVDRYLGTPVSLHGGWVDTMFNTTLFFTGVVFMITQALLFWFAFRYQGRKNRKAFYLPHNNKLEIVWTAVPAVVLTVLVVMGIEYWNKIKSPPGEDPVVVEVVAERYGWIIRYAGMDNEFGPRDNATRTSTNKLGIDWDDPASQDDIMPDTIFIPKGKEVLFRLGAQDVLHSFYLPQFRLKQDCVPGIPTSHKVTATMTTQEYRDKYEERGFNNFELACAELCGSGHYNMRKVVVVLEEEEFNQWLEKQQPYYELMQSMASN